MSSVPVTPVSKVQVDEPRSTPRRASQKSSRGTQGPHLERLNEHLRKLQDDLSSCTSSRHPSVAGEAPQERRGAETPRIATPRGRSFAKVLCEQQQLQRELAAERGARDAAEARALVSADEAAAAAQWAQAVTHENEKLHQLTGLQGAIVASLQEGHASADAACRHAKELARTSQRAKRASQEAGQLHSSLLQHTGHAKALEQRVEALKAAMKDLRLAAGAKDAELAIIKAEAEAFRRQLIPSAKSTLSADTEMHSGGDAQKQRLKGMHERILQRTIPIEEVWAEVQHCEERVQLLCTITRAVETHVSILQDELCKAHAETARAKDELSEQERLVRDLRRASAAVPAGAEKFPELEAQLALQQRDGAAEAAKAGAAAAEDRLTAALKDLKAAEEEIESLRVRGASASARPEPGSKPAASAAKVAPVNNSAAPAATEHSPKRVIERARSIERLSTAAATKPSPTKSARRHSVASVAGPLQQKSTELQQPEPEGSHELFGATGGPSQAARQINAAPKATPDEHGATKLRTPEPEKALAGGTTVPQPQIAQRHSTATAVRRAGNTSEGARRSSSGSAVAGCSPVRATDPSLSERRQGPVLTFASLIPPLSPLQARIAAQQDGAQKPRAEESIIPRIWRSTQKRTLSAESDADIRSIPDADESKPASTSVMPKPSGSSPILASLPKSPSAESPLKTGAANSGDVLIKAHAGGQLSECRDSMCEGTAVTSTFISLGDVLRNTALSGASSILAQASPEATSQKASGVVDTSEGQSGGAVASSAAEEARSGSRGEKRDVRGLRREAQGGPEAASSASPSGAGRTRSVYMPVKLQDLAQIGQADSRESGSRSARSSQESVKDKWTPLTARRTSAGAESANLGDVEAAACQRSPLTEVHLCSISLPPLNAFPEPSGKGASAAAKKGVPDMEVCLSPALPLQDGPPSFGSALPNKGLQKARRPKKPPTPRGGLGPRSSFSGELTTPQVGRPSGVPMLDASLCNVVGSPISPQDGLWAEVTPGMHGSVSSRSEPKQATGAGLGTVPSPAEEAIQRAKQAAEMRATPGDSPALVAAGPPGAYVSSDVAAPSAALGRRHKVPMLNLSRESLRMSVEAITPPCSFPLRAQKKAEREAQWAAAAAAAQTGRSDGSSEGSQDQATYELAATSYTGGPLPDASSCNILKESSTFIHEPTQVVPDQPQPPAQAAEGTPRAEAQQQQTVATPPGSASRKGSSFFQRLSPLLRKKEAGRESQEATPQKGLPDPSPRKGFGKLSPARWGWGGKGSAKKGKGTAGSLAAETCSPLRDGASAMGRADAQTPKGRRRLSPKKMSPWLGK